MKRWLFVTLVTLPLGSVMLGCSRPAASRSAFSSGRREVTGQPARTPRNAPYTMPGSEVVPVAAPIPHMNEANINDIVQHVRDRTAVFIDARSAQSFAAGHLPGAYNVPAGDIEGHMTRIWENVPLNALIVVYCVSRNCHAADRVYEYLESQGFTNVRLFRPGWHALSADPHLIER